MHQTLTWEQVVAMVIFLAVSSAGMAYLAKVIVQRHQRKFRDQALIILAGRPYSGKAGSVYDVMKRLKILSDDGTEIRIPREGRFTPAVLGSAIASLLSQEEKIEDRYNQVARGLLTGGYSRRQIRQFQQGAWQHRTEVGMPLSESIQRISQLIASNRKDRKENSRLEKSLKAAEAWKSPKPSKR